MLGWTRLWKTLTLFSHRHFPKWLHQKGQWQFFYEAMFQWGWNENVLMRCWKYPLQSTNLNVWYDTPIHVRNLKVALTWHSFILWLISRNVLSLHTINNLLLQLLVNWSHMQMVCFWNWFRNFQIVLSHCYWCRV